LGTAFLGSEGWDELGEGVDGCVYTEAWLRRIADVRTQVVVRHLLPAHHSTAALDTALGRIRDFVDSRVQPGCCPASGWTTNLMLGLIRQHLNWADIERDYQRALGATSTPSAASCQAPARNPRAVMSFLGSSLFRVGGLVDLQPFCD
jgi:hypothetical protein